jgi:AraC-like DNA-binding protein
MPAADKLEARGPATRAVAWPDAPGRLSVTLLLHARWLPAVLGRPASSFRDRTLSLEDTRRLALALMAGYGAGPQANLDASPSQPAWRQAVCKSLPQAQQVCDVLARANDLAQVRAQLGWPARRLQRWCAYHLGLTPEHLLRLFRLHRSTTLLVDGPGSYPWQAPPASLAEQALQAGYADQSHMGRDFRLLADATPTQAAQADAVLRASALLAQGFQQRG